MMRCSNCNISSLLDSVMVMIIESKFNKEDLEVNWTYLTANDTAAFANISTSSCIYWASLAKKSCKIANAWFVSSGCNSTGALTRISSFANGWTCSTTKLNPICFNTWVSFVISCSLRSCMDNWDLTILFASSKKCSMCMPHSSTLQARNKQAKPMSFSSPPVVTAEAAAA